MAWSPDGERISLHPPHRRPRPDLHGCSSPGTGATVLSGHPTAAGSRSRGVAGCTRWRLRPATGRAGKIRPGRRTVAASLSRASWVATARSGRRAATDGGGDPAWSPDGLTIAHTSGGNLFLVSDGRDRRQLTRGSRGGHSCSPAVVTSTWTPTVRTGRDSPSPAWSPDGARIPMPVIATDIVVMDTDGTDQRVVAREPELVGGRRPDRFRGRKRPGWAGSRSPRTGAGRPTERLHQGRAAVHRRPDGTGEPPHR